MGPVILFKWKMESHCQLLLLPSKDGKKKPPFSVMKGTCTRQKRENSHGLRRKDETLSQMHLAELIPLNLFSHLNLDW